MVKITSKIPDLKGQQVSAYKQDLSKESKTDLVPLNNESCANNLINLDESNKHQNMVKSNELVINNIMRDNPHNMNSNHSNKLLLIENYAEILIRNLRLVNSNGSKLGYYYQDKL